MTTRRQWLALAGAAGVAGFTAGCKARGQGAVQTTPGPQVRLAVRHTDGVGLLDAATGSWHLAPARACLPHDGAQLVTARHDGGRTKLARYTVSGGELSTLDLDGVWTPRTTGAQQVALVQGADVGEVYAPRGRATTTLLVTGAEQRRYHLPGNVEPEAFSPDGNKLYLLDYLPPRAPDLYRVRVMDLSSGRVDPLSIKDKGLVPPGAEETMRGHGRHAVYDPASGVLFTLYTHGGEHQHTGQLLGVRPDAPEIHAFIHALHLQQGWAVCIDLPRPFGLGAAAGHTLTAAPAGDLLYAVTAEHGTVAEISRSGLKIVNRREFPALSGAAAAVSTADGPLLAVGGTVTDLRATWRLDHPLHGMRQTPDGLLWTVGDGALLGLDWAARKVVHRVQVTGLVAVA